VSKVLRQIEARASKTPSAQPPRTLPREPVTDRGQQTHKRKAKSQEGSAVNGSPAAQTATAQPAATAKLSYSAVVRGEFTDSRQAILVLSEHIQQQDLELGKLRGANNKLKDELITEQSRQLEHLGRYSRRNSLMVFGVAESVAYNTPQSLVAHMQALLFESEPASASTIVRSAYRFGKWSSERKKPRPVLVELLSVSAKHIAFKASKRLRASHIRLDEYLTPQQLKERSALGPDFLNLKVGNYTPFFRGTTLKYRDGPVVRKCAKGESIKLLETRAARPSASPVPRRSQPARRTHTSVAMDPAATLRQAGVTILAAQLSSALNSPADDDDVESGMLSDDAPESPSGYGVLGNTHG